MIVHKVILKLEKIMLNVYQENYILIYSRVLIILIFIITAIKYCTFSYCIISNCYYGKINFAYQSLFNLMTFLKFGGKTFSIYPLLEEYQLFLKWVPSFTVFTIATSLDTKRVWFIFSRCVIISKTSRYILLQN